MKKEIIKITPDMDFDERNRAIDYNFKIKKKEEEKQRKKLLNESILKTMTKEERFEYWKVKHKKEYKKLTALSKGEKLRKTKIEEKRLLVNKIIQMKNNGMTAREIAYTLEFTRQHISFIIKQNKELINMENVKENRYLKSITLSKRELEMIEEMKKETGLTNASSIIHIALTEYYRSIFPAYLKKNKIKE